VFGAGTKRRLEGWAQTQLALLSRQTLVIIRFFLAWERGHGRRLQLNAHDRARLKAEKGLTGQDSQDEEGSRQSPISHCVEGRPLLTRGPLTCASACSVALP
jgi:hypothetical protein